MADERISTIIKEISYWKEHKLLPEMYCDYLLALYTNGEGVAEENSVTNKRIQFAFIVKIVLQLLLIPFSFLIIYFTEIHSIMQLSILIIFISLSFWQYKTLRKSYLNQISLMMVLLLFFLTTVFISDQYFDNQWIISVVILLNFIAWLIISIKDKLVYLKVLGIIGFIFTALYIVL